MGEVEELPKWWSFFGGMILSHRTILGVAKASISGSCSREAFNSGPAVTKEFDLMCWRGSECILFRLCLFWVKITSGNAFPKMRLFGWSGKFYFPEIEIRWPKKKAFDHGNAFTLLFSLQSISEKWEREKERARARERRRSSQFDDRRRTTSSSPRRSRELQSDDREDSTSSSSSPRSRLMARSREGEIAIAPSITISDRDWRRGRRTGNIFVVDDFFF